MMCTDSEKYEKKVLCITRRSYINYLFRAIEVVCSTKK